jgi:hypothetical protein
VTLAAPFVARGVGVHSHAACGGLLPPHPSNARARFIDDAITSALSGGASACSPYVNAQEAPGDAFSQVVLLGAGALPNCFVEHDVRRMNHPRQGSMLARCGCRALPEARWQCLNVIIRR